MKSKGNTHSLSTGNKKRNDHKPIQEEQVEKVKKKRRKRSKKAKNNIDYTGRKLMSEEQLKAAREDVIKNLIPRKPYLTYKYEDDCKTCLGVGCKYCAIKEIGKTNE